MAYFFFSYAREDRSDPYIKQFHDDLASEVRSLTGTASAQEMGFFDSESIETGVDWQQQIRDALQSSRVLVTLFSPTYFMSQYCGKEWWVFRQRQDAYLNANPGIRPPVILPV